MNNQQNREFEPDFDFPEPPDEPDFTAAAAILPPPAAAAPDPAALAARLGWSIPLDALTDAQRIGAAAGLCQNDAMWPIILLQLRILGAFGAVPTEVTKTVKAVVEEIRKAARAESEVAAIETAKSTKKEILRTLAARDEGCGWLGEWGWHLTAAGAAGAGVIGFFCGNVSTIQYSWVLTIAEFFGVGV